MSCRAFKPTFLPRRLPFSLNVTESVPSLPSETLRAESERRRVSCDATAAEPDDARDSLDRSRRELDVERANNQPLQDDLRRVSALLVAHAEEHQQDGARTARAAGLENALALSQQASQAEIARLGDLIDQSDLVYTERTMTWRRLLREARAGRESARLVHDALVTRLSDMVTAVGGSLDVTQLVRSLESRVEASTYAATPLL
ncbi:hypothetical protein PHMEG_00039671 [Phytophthora megakarya]|uniref:Uncharacterized protein n=1 Tax=Phytophthora megakarya TaxID=4795 RepID=A0A225UHS9_9STRA|nr:hypothetical protein PHMEG_00039671 [Phytophthora megakarya]